MWLTVAKLVTYDPCHGCLLALGWRPHLNHGSIHGRVKPSKLGVFKLSKTSSHVQTQQRRFCMTWLRDDTECLWRKPVGVVESGEDLTARRIRWMFLKCLNSVKHEKKTTFVTFRRLCVFSEGLHGFDGESRWNFCLLSSNQLTLSCTIYKNHSVKS